MKFNNIFVYIIASMACTACSTDNENVISNNDNNKVSFSASIGSKKTGARVLNAGEISGQSFQTNDKFIAGFKSLISDNVKESAGIREITLNNGNVFQPNTPLYWDDLGGRETDAFVWGVYTHENNDIQIDEEGSFVWSIPVVQTNENFANADLLYSNNVTHLKYTPDQNKPSERGIANLSFNHAMSRFVVNLKVGNGITTEEINNATVTLISQNIKASIKLLNQDTIAIANDNTPSDITMMKRATANESYDNTLQAIVVPFKEYAVGDNILLINAANNTYTLKANQNFINALNNNKLEKGKCYTFNITIDKQDIKFTANITDWTTGYETAAGTSEDGQIVIDATDKGIGGNQSFTDTFSLYQSVNDENGYNYGNDNGIITPATECTFSDSKWNYSPTLYWQATNEKDFFRGFYPSNTEFTASKSNDVITNIATLSSGNIDYKWGTSGDTQITPTSGKVKLAFNHIMSSIIVNLKTVSGNAAVVLDGAEVELIHTSKTGTFNLHTGVMTPGTIPTNEDAIAFKANGNQYSCFTIPQTLNGNNGSLDSESTQFGTDDAYLRITIKSSNNSNNIYYLKLNNAQHNSQIIDTWESGKKYTYNITLQKKEISFTTVITNWDEVFNGDFNVDLGD